MSIEIVSIKHGDTKFASLTQNGVLTLTTAGKYIEDNLSASINGNIPRNERKSAYNNQKLVYWNGSLFTVDEANKIFYEYLAEGNTEKCQVLTMQISKAKQQIREFYPFPEADIELEANNLKQLQEELGIK